MNEREPGADDVMATPPRCCAALMSSVTPFVCGSPLYIWQPLHFLSVFDGFGGLGHSARRTPPLHTAARKGPRRRGGADRPTARRRLIDPDDVGER